MRIRSLTRQQCVELLSRGHLAHLACALDRQPYVVPIFFAFDGHHLFSFTMPGQKLEWMRLNPNVCVEAEEHGPARQWRSVVVIGQFEELADTTLHQHERDHAWTLLSRHANWWEPGSLKPQPETIAEKHSHVFYRIHIHTMTGREVVEEKGPAPRHDSGSSRSGHWLRKAVRRMTRTG